MSILDIFMLSFLVGCGFLSGYYLYWLGKCLVQGYKEDISKECADREGK